MAKSSRTGRAQDSIDRLLAEWGRERPDLDPWPLAIQGRIQRLSGHLTRHAEGWLSELDLGWETFSLIVTLRRSGRPYALRPTDLYRESLLSSGAITNRIDRVEERGWVRRELDPRDRRAVVVRLTRAGRMLADRAITHQFRSMAQLLSMLNRSERNQLATLLTKVLLSVERQPPKQRISKRKSPAAQVRQGRRATASAQRSAGTLAPP